MALGMELGLGPSHIVLDGDPGPPKKGTAPNFRPMSIVAKRLDGSRCHFGMEVGLGPGHIVLDGDTAPFPKKGQSPSPNFPNLGKS